MAHLLINDTMQNPIDLISFLGGTGPPGAGAYPNQGHQDKPPTQVHTVITQVCHGNEFMYNRYFDQRSVLGRIFHSGNCPFHNGGENGYDSN